MDVRAGAVRSAGSEKEPDRARGISPECILVLQRSNGPGLASPLFRCRHAPAAGRRAHADSETKARPSQAQLSVGERGCIQG